jgi:hypothetical protein
VHLPDILIPGCRRAVVFLATNMIVTEIDSARQSPASGASSTEDSRRRCVDYLPGVVFRYRIHGPRNDLGVVPLLLHHRDARPTQLLAEIGSSPERCPRT